MMIPHDHHADALSDINSDACPYTNHHHNFPVHCHALNDLLPEKLHVLLIHSIFDSQTFVIPRNCLNHTGELSAAGIPFYLANDKITSVVPHSESLLRAPPLNS
jgi:hypothetical protein